jgi:hypothetical protein
MAVIYKCLWSARVSPSFKHCLTFSGVCTIKHYGSVMFGIRSKLPCMSNPVPVSDNNKTTLAYYKMRPCSVHYESVMFYSTGTRYGLEPTLEGSHWNILHSGSLLPYSKTRLRWRGFSWTLAYLAICKFTVAKSFITLAHWRQCYKTFSQDKKTRVSRNNANVLKPFFFMTYAPN